MSEDSMPLRRSLSVGLEDAADLFWDLDQALTRG